MNIRVLDSALKHGLDESEIKHAMENSVCSKSRKNAKGNNVYSCVGILPTGQTCELMFYINKFFQHVVFHAMSPARNAFVKDVQSKKKGAKK